MKNILFGLVCLAAQASFAQIKFEQAVTMNPLVVRVTSASCSSRYTEECIFTDKAYVQRLKLDITNGQYELRNSNSDVIAKVTASKELLKQTGRILYRSSSDCPGDIYIDRNSLKIFEARSSCSTGGVSTMVLSSKGTERYTGAVTLYDSSYNTLLTYNGSSYTIKSNTVIESAKIISSADASKFATFVAGVRSNCPLTIDYNSQTGEIVKMKLGCDPLAAIDDGRRDG